MTTVTRRIEFDAAHRVLGHEGKCRHLHGHRYVCEVTVRAPDLDPLGRVIDFGVVKQLLGGWVDDNWDHNALLNPEDRLWTDPECRNAAFSERIPYLMPPGRNPTAENIAVELCVHAMRLLPDHLTITNARVYETPNCWADYTPSSP